MAKQKSGKQASRKLVKKTAPTKQKKAKVIARKKPRARAKIERRPTADSDMITESWIQKRRFPYGALVDRIIDLLCIKRHCEEADLPTRLYQLWLVRRFETDVSNGGFPQFLCNSLDSRDGSDRFLRETLPAVRAFGLDELEPFVAETIDLYDWGMEFGRRHFGKDWDRKPEQTACRIPSADPIVVSGQKRFDDVFNDLEERYRAVDYKSWVGKLEHYIKTHVNEFVFDPSAETKKDPTGTRPTRRRAK